ncbi:flagellar basal body rod protein FlgB [Gilvimarinus sp. SDUM040013]|uniref:Flagellar basal body rod protein FlgB n=1 Tax=Gilvimarinus gilvus TaxID=3058038 RepID=A0ABU4RU99_9GAMM|nr:flagellar basal body rod protein FlgB [Gilvimarinus sp. SDUM040013]MDO3385085.1 flagellar basal body rod protein FlgB [Gilvimarinus sp. SDUM040013]MDX6848460.1 flagellar basal body rod protein FlgB [Gilvimarinus sp. SDUM040013]
MAISFDQALGVFEPALKLRSQRAEVLANNLANADTPGFKARDFDFSGALAEASKSQPFAMAKTANAHMNAFGADASAHSLAYRTPHQPSIDGNTVEDQVEHAEFMKNALEFQTSFMMLNKKFKGLSKALTGQ